MNKPAKTTNTDLWEKLTGRRETYVEFWGRVGKLLFFQTDDGTIALHEKRPQVSLDLFEGKITFEQAVRRLRLNKQERAALEAWFYYPPDDSLPARVTTQGKALREAYANIAVNPRLALWQLLQLDVEIGRPFPEPRKPPAEFAIAFNKYIGGHARKVRMSPIGKRALFVVWEEPRGATELAWQWKDAKGKRIMPSRLVDPQMIWWPKMPENSYIFIRWLSHWGFAADELDLLPEEVLPVYWCVTTYRP